MAYRKVYLRIKCHEYDSFSTRGTDLTAFKTESRRLFQDLGWTLHAGGKGVCDTVTKGRQDLYLHPQSFSGVLDEADIPLLREQLARAQSFQCYAAEHIAKHFESCGSAPSRRSRSTDRSP